MILKLVGNKIDVPDDEIKVTREMGKKFADEYQILFGECSAKSGEGVDLVFKDIVDQFYKKHQPKKTIKF